MKGDSTDAKREIEKLSKGKIQEKVSVAREEREHDRRVLKK